MRRSPRLGRDICPRCHGTGETCRQLQPKAPAVRSRCNRCGGTGEIARRPPQVSSPTSPQLEWAAEQRRRRREGRALLKARTPWQEEQLANNAYGKAQLT